MRKRVSNVSDRDVEPDSSADIVKVKLLCCVSVHVPDGDVDCVRCAVACVAVLEGVFEVDRDVVNDRRLRDWLLEFVWTSVSLALSDNTADAEF